MPYRILVAKPGLDGHDRGAKVVARLLRDAGHEVIYTGIRQRPDEIAVAAVAEDVCLVGLSILSGAHLGLTNKVMAALEARGAGDIPVIVGGTIPTGDAETLMGRGVAAVYPTGTKSEVLLRGIQMILEGEQSVLRTVGAK
jgi:methylmalonyl-CoA mutase C-terminal domain/subunit